MELVYHIGVNFDCVDFQRFLKLFLLKIERDNAEGLERQGLTAVLSSPRFREENLT